MGFGGGQCGQHFLDECRWVTPQCGPEIVEIEPHGLDAYCCGAGGGAWAMPYVQERIDYGKFKADQIKATGADLICAPCHNCRDQIMKALTARRAWTGIQTKVACQV